MRLLHQGLPRLLGPQDPPPFVAQNLGAATPWVIICDHAGRLVPGCLDSLGLAADHFQRHIAVDIGAGALSVALSDILGAACIRQTYSRLVVDCNRAPGRSDQIVTRTDGVEPPGNIGLSADQAEARLAEIFHPYHDRIAAELDRRAAAGRLSALVSVHSFTPVFQGFVRPWHVGVLHDRQSQASRIMLDLLAAEPDLTVGDNEPYAMDNIDYTIPRHAIAQGIPYLELEIRQDLIADEAGVARFAELLGRLVPQAFASELPGAGA